MSTASIYSVPREARNILKRFRKAAPSLTIELYPNHFRFAHQSGIFLYDSPMSAFLDAVRAQQIPAQFLSTLSSVRPDGKPIAFYDGCLIIELVDYRASVAQLEVNGGGGGPQPTPVRVILQPTPESSWVDLQMLSDEIGRGRWDDGDLLEVEARILASTAPPLHTGTSLYALRVANEACASSSHLASAARPSASRARSRTYADGDSSSAFSLLRTGAPSASSHTANFRATFARLQNIESFRQRAATDETLKNPDPFKSRLAPPPSRPNASSPDKPSTGAASGSGGNVYESRPNSPQGKAGGKRRASTAALGDEEDGASKKKAATGGSKKKKKKVVPDAAPGDAAPPESPDKAATPAAPAKKKAPSKKKKKDADTDAESTAAAPTPAASEAEDTKSSTAAKKAPLAAKSKGKKAQAAAAAAGTPASSTAGATPTASSVSGKSPAGAAGTTASTAPPPIQIPRPPSASAGLPQSFANHVQKGQQPFSLALPNVANGGGAPAYPDQMPNGVPTTAAGLQQALLSMQGMQQQQQGMGQPMPQSLQIAHLQAQFARSAQAGQQQQQFPSH